MPGGDLVSAAYQTGLPGEIALRATSKGVKNVIEVELKCELFPGLLPKLRERLQHMTFDGIVHNVDRYYDTPRFDLLRQIASGMIINSNLSSTRKVKKRIFRVQSAFFLSSPTRAHVKI